MFCYRPLADVGWLSPSHRRVLERATALPWLLHGSDGVTTAYGLLVALVEKMESDRHPHNADAGNLNARRGSTGPAMCVVRLGSKRNRRADADSGLGCCGEDGLLDEALRSSIAILQGLLQADYEGNRGGPKPS